jgi:hypothetical protein
VELKEPGEGRWPGGRSFAFTVVDDTDGSTVANVKPVYDLLQELGLRTTKTVWMQRSSRPDQFAASGTMQDGDYAAFVLDLHRKGFEIALHMAAPGPSRREETIAAYDAFRRTFGADPAINANHSMNTENLYWGRDRFDGALLRWLYGRMTPWESFRGHEEGSEWFWGDVCRARTRYLRNFTFDEIDTLKVNPGMPYHDPRRPHVNLWFSSADGSDGRRFTELIREESVARLERNGGCCIVYTHFAKGFLKNGRLDPVWESRMRALAKRPGWFVPASPVLDHLLARTGGSGGRALGWGERTRLTTRWAFERLRDRSRARRRPRG